MRAKLVDALLRENDETWFLINEIHEKTGMPKASCKRYMSVSYERGQVYKRKASRGHARAFEYRYKDDYCRKRETWANRDPYAPGGTAYANAAQGKGARSPIAVEALRRARGGAIESMRW